MSNELPVVYHRPVVGYGGTTINTLRLWAAAAPDYFEFQVFSQVGRRSLIDDGLLQVNHSTGSTMETAS
jgi:hypothetical protein